MHGWGGGGFQMRGVVCQISKHDLINSVLTKWGSYEFTGLAFLRHSVFKEKGPSKSGFWPLRYRPYPQSLYDHSLEDQAP